MADVTIRFVPDTGDLEARLKTLQSELDGLNNRYAALAKAEKDALAAGDLEKAVDAGKQLDALAVRRIQLLTKIDDAIARIAGKQKALTDSAEAEDAARKQNIQRLNQQREQMEKIASVGQKLAVLGAAMLAPFALSMEKYKNAAGQSEIYSRRLLDAQNKIEQSQIRIGRVTAQTVAPAYAKLAEYAEKAAALAEKNPDAVKNAVGGAAAIAGIGTTLTVGAQAAGAVNALQSIAGAGGAGGAIAGATLSVAEVAIVAGAVYLGAKGGNWLGNEFNKKLGLPEQSLDSALYAGRQLMYMASGLTYAAKGLDAVTGKFGGNFSTDDAWKTILGIGPAGQEDLLTLIGNKINPPKPPSAASALSAYRAGEIGGYAGKTDVERAAEAKEKQRLEIEKYYAEERVKVEAKAGASIADLTAKNAASAAQAAAALASEIAGINNQLNADLEKMAREHHKALQKMERDHDGRMRDLANARDALGLAAEKRQHDNAVRETNRDYKDAVSERKRAAAEQINSLRLAANAEAKLRREAYNQQIADLMRAKTIEIGIIRQTENEKMRILLGSLQRVSAAAYSTTYTTAGNTRNRAAGGYMDFGSYTVSEGGREFALSAATTRAAENTIGGELTQARLLRALNVNFNLSNGVTLAQTRRMVRQETGAIMSGLQKAFAGGI